jgi:two-component system LytT family sensor kinase
MKRLAVTSGIVFLITLVAYAVRTISGQFEPALNRIIFFASFFLIFISWESLLFVNRILNRYYPFERGIAVRIAMQFVIGAVIALFIRFLIYQFGEPMLPFTLDKMFLASTWVLYILAASVINSIFITAFFIDRWKESIITAERLEKEKALVQFDNLKNQLNPHFLFNAMTSLNSLIFENQDLASQFLQHLSKVYRYVLQNKDKNFVSLQTELDFIQNYAFLLQTRFENALAINIDIRQDARDRAIVPVTLQILIENAIKHNVVDKSSPLAIDISSIGNYLVISNNLQNKKKLVETSNKQGLDNLKSLYRFMTDNPVVIEQTDTRFAVKVPLV